MTNKDWEDMKAMMIRTGSVILTDDMMQRSPTKPKGDTLNGYGKATDKDVQGECSIRTRAKTE